MVASDAALIVFVLCPLVSVKAAATARGHCWALESFVGGRQCCSQPVSDSQQKCADRKTLTRISPLSVIKDPRPQSTAIS